MKDKVPFLHQLLSTIIPLPNLTTIATIYGMIMHSRNMHASAIQRMMTTLCIKCHADNKLLKRLNKVHVTLSAESKRTIIKEMSERSTNKIIEEVSKGNDGKINGDNLDIYVQTNDIRMENHNKDYHFFASDWTPFRISDKDFELNPYLSSRVREPRKEACLETFLPNLDETKLVKNSMKILVGKILSEHCRGFRWLDLVLPKEIPHELSHEMARKTQSFQMPILLKNEMHADECIHIMDAYVKQTSDWYSKANRENDYKKLKIPVGGDQLTRARLDGARSCRAGSHSDADKFENIFPVVVELFHTLMDFVEKVYLTFMKASSAKDKGTLAHLKIVTKRTSVNGKVKSRYKAHEDFLSVVGTGYILEAAKSHFRMSSITDQPMGFPENVEKLHSRKRSELFEEKVGDFVDLLIGPCSFNEESMKENVHVSVDDENVIECNVNDGNVVLPVMVDEVNVYRLQHPKESLQKGQMVKVIVPSKGVTSIKLAERDDLFNYVFYFTSIYLIILSFKDAIATGDIVRINSLLKFMMPFLYCHSSLSKYLVECVDYIHKTEVLLPPKLAVLVQTSSLVNGSGRAGHNIPADMQKENQVKELKDLIKSLGSNKTEKSIVTISKAAPIINDIVNKFDNQVDIVKFSTRHKKRCSNQDLTSVLKVLDELKPCDYKAGRRLSSYGKLAKNVYANLREKRLLFENEILSIVYRLKINMPILNDADDSELEVDDSEDDEI